MPPQPYNIHKHAIERLQERFGVGKEWLLHELENGRFVWLQSSSYSRDTKNVRSGYLIYLPNKNEYCVVIIDNRSRLAITVLNEEMALNSSWGKGIDETAKLKAKRTVLGKETIDDSYFLHLYAKERGKLTVRVCARTFLYDWKPVKCVIYKTCIEAMQIDAKNKVCTLSNEQIVEVSKIFNQKIEKKEVRPFCELLITTSNGKNLLVSNRIIGTSCIDEAADYIDEALSIKRWEWTAQ